MAQSQFVKFARSSGTIGEDQDADPKFAELEAKFGPGGDEEQAKARAEWIARGYPEKTFTMEKMARLWEDDDRNEIQQSNDLGISRLSEKDEMLQLAEDRELSNVIGKVISKNNAKISAESSAWFKKAWEAVKDTLTPDAVKRQHEFREYERAVTHQQVRVALLYGYFSWFPVIFDTHSTGFDASELFRPLRPFVPVTVVAVATHYRRPPSSLCLN